MEERAKELEMHWMTISLLDGARKLGGLWRIRKEKTMWYICQA